MEVDLINQNENIYKLDYENQNIDDNINILKWKQLMLTKNNNNKHLILFKCKKDKILFYDNYYDNHYLGFCPICKKYICYFCSFYNKSKNSDLICCLKRLINTRFFIYGPKYTKRNDLCSCFSIGLFIPGFSIILIGMYIIINISEGVAREKSKKSQVLESTYLEEKSVFIFTEILMPFVLLIPFFILNTYFILIIIIISIPLKLIPLKYILGVFDAKEDAK